MKYEHFFISNKDDKSNCVIRSFCKLYNKDYDETYTELCNIQKELNCESYNDIEVFETFMKRNNTNKIEYGKDMKIKDSSAEYAIGWLAREDKVWIEKRGAHTKVGLK